MKQAYLDTLKNNYEHRQTSIVNILQISMGTLHIFTKH